MRTIIFALVLGINFISNSYADNSNWMSLIDDNKKLNQITLPGSHDAGMSETKNCNPFIGTARIAQTQNLNILDQARAGSRYYDIRIDYDKGFWEDRAYLLTYHRTGRLGCSGQHLDTILDQAIIFLKQNPSETLILKFSHTRNYEEHSETDITSRVIDLIKIDKYKSYLFTSLEQNLNIADLPLKEIRGKIIAVFDNEYYRYINPSKGIFRYFDNMWANAGLNVYDNYSNTTDYTSMKNDQLHKLSNYGGFNRQYLFLLSWTLTSNGWNSTEDLAREANSNLPHELNNIYQSSNNAKPNIVFIDYVNPEITQKIIQCNFM